MAFASNLNVLRAGFVWDDRALIIGNDLIKHWGTLPQLFRQSFLGLYYRPIVMLSFAAEYALWGLRPAGFHLTNLLLHVANAVLVFLILREVTRSRGTALVAALLFVSHPAHKGIVAIADRTGILSGFFFLSSLGLYIYYSRSANRRGALFSYAGAVALCALAFFSKEETVTLPLILILTDLLIIDEKPKLFNLSKLVRYIPFLSLAVLYVLIRSNVLGSGGGLINALLVEPARRLITIPAILFDYVVLLLFPLHLDFEPRTPVATWVGEPRILLSLLLLLALIVLIPWLARKKKDILFGLLWYFVVFIPMSNIVPIYPEAAHSHVFTPIHFLYLPSIGIFLCSAIGFNGLLRRLEARRGGWRTTAIIALCGVVLLFSLLSVNRNFIWEDELRFYQYVVRMHPENDRMRLNLGNVYLERGRVDEGLKQLEQAVILAPNVASHRNSLALAYEDKGWLDRAEAEFHEALRLDPNSGMAYANLAALYRKQGKLPEAIAAGRKAVDLAPASATAHSNLGLVYKDAGDLAMAEEHFRAAIRLDPNCAVAHNGLGILFALNGRYALARAQWEKALQAKPEMTEARENLQKLERMGY